MDIRSLFVKAGDLVLPAWNKLLEVLLSFRILAGRGILLTPTSGGVIINIRQLVEGFVGSWDVSLSGDFIKVKSGFVNALEPLIDKRPISGRNDPKGQPVLKLKEDKYDETGRSWLAIRLQIDKLTGKIIAPTTAAPKGPLELTIVQTATLIDQDDTVWLHPIAVLLRPAKEKTGFGVLHKISYFDLQHRTARQDNKWRHYLDPA